MNDTLPGGTASRQGVPAVVAKTELDSDLLYNTSIRSCYTRRN